MSAAGLVDVTLAPGRERSVVRKHPWLLSGAIQRVQGDGSPGALARVLASDGRVLGFGHFSPASQIRVRLLTFGDGPPPTDELIEARIAHAVKLRASDPSLAGTNGLRLVNAEGDGLPGLTVDRFDDVLVVKLASAGMAARRSSIARALEAVTGARTCLERADATAARRESFDAHEGVLFGAEPPERITLDERGRRYLVDVARGQKTGFYLDQRDARDFVQHISAGRRVLDLYSHTGGFGVAAGRGGAASVVLVDSSREALVVAEENMQLNAPEVPCRIEHGDVHKFLRANRETFDVVVVDPPPLAKSKHDAERSARAYKDAFLFAMARASSDAFVLVFSCSHHVGPVLLGQITFGAALDAHRTFQIVRVLSQPSDHPVSIDHPEGAYLSGLVLRAT